MIVVEKFSFGFPQKDLYEEISFRIEKGQHCAFIGSSGCGKSTFIEIIRNLDKYMYDGTITIDTKRKIGFVSQFTECLNLEMPTVFDFIAEEYIKLEKEAEFICKEMENSLDSEKLLEKYQNVLDSLEAMGGIPYKNIIEAKLNIAGLEKQKDLKISDLSGGEVKIGRAHV